MATIPSIAMIPSGYKASKVYSVLPTDGAGDLTFSRAGALPSFNATRVNSEGLIEEVLSNVPRFDYSDGVCPSLLIEPQSTNLFTNAEGINNFSTLGRVNCTYNLGSAFNGFSSSCRVNFGTFTNNFVRAVLTYNAVLGINNVFSLHFKKKTGFFVKISQGNATNAFEVSLNLETGQLISATGTALNNTFVKQLADDCFRVSFLTSANSTTIAGLINISYYNNSDFNNWTNSDNNNFALISGIQLENNVTYATSYIPTVASTVTRVADVVSKTGISSLIGQTEGTLFVDYNKAEIQSSKGILELGEINNEIVIWQNTASQLRFFIRVNGITFGSRTFNFSDERLKIALTYQTDSYSVFLNGVKILENIDITSLSSSYNGFILGNRFVNSAINAINSGINLTAIFKTQLSDQECINLTTL